MRSQSGSPEPALPALHLLALIQAAVPGGRALVGLALGLTLLVSNYFAAESFQLEMASRTRHCPCQRRHLAFSGFNVSPAAAAGELVP